MKEVLWEDVKQQQHSQKMMHAVGYILDNMSLTDAKNWLKDNGIDFRVEGDLGDAQYREDRLNLVVDASGMIVQATIG